MLHFGEKNYKHVAYIRFDCNERMRAIFEASNYNMKELLLNIQAKTE